MFRILDVYVGKTIITTIILVLSVFVGLSAVIKFVEQLRSVGEGSYTMLSALYFVILGMPRDIELFFSMAALLGSLVGLGMLASSSELVVMQAAGISKLRIGLSVLKTAVPLMVVVMALGEWGAPTTQQMARDLRLKRHPEVALYRLGMVSGLGMRTTSFLFLRSMASLLKD